jgi:nucleotide-binding universal stress UspA family protein
MNLVDCDLVVLRSPRDWRLSNVRRILVPTAGRGQHDDLLARVLASFSRGGERQVTALRVLPLATTAGQRGTVERSLKRMVRDVCHGDPTTEVILSDSAVSAIAQRAADTDLMILGTQRDGRRRLFGSFVTQIARATSVPLLLISRRS